MKKITPLILSLALLSQAAFAGISREDVRLKTPSSGVIRKTASGGALSGGARTLLQKLLAVGDLRWFKDLRSGPSITADYAKALDTTENSTTVNVAPYNVTIPASAGNIPVNNTTLEFFQAGRQYKIRQDCNVTSFQMYVDATTSTITNIQLGIWREGRLNLGSFPLDSYFGNGSFTLIARSENVVAQITPGAKATYTFTLATPIAAKVGDSYSVLITTTNSGSPLEAITVDQDFHKTISAVDQANNRLTVTDHGFSSGQYFDVYSLGGGVPAGMTDDYDQIYYAKVIDANTIEVYSDSGLTSVVDITGAGSGTMYVGQGYYRTQLFQYSGTAPSTMAWRTNSGSNTWYGQIALPVQIQTSTAPYFVAMGDSITSGAQWSMSSANRNLGTTTGQDVNEERFNLYRDSSGNNAGTWPAYLSYLTGKTYQNMGINGETAAVGSARITTDAVNLKPRECILMYGTNDASNSVSVNSFIASYTTMLDALVAAGIRPIVLSTPGADVLNTTKSQLADSYNTAIQTLLLRYPTAKYIDIRPAVNVTRAGGDAGNLWDINTSYRFSNEAPSYTHIDTPGLSAFASQVFSTRTARLNEGARIVKATAARTASSPATYFDANRVMKTTTTADTPLHTYGYYGTSGWVNRPGWIKERASTNILLRSDMTQYSGGQMTSWVGPSTTATGTITYSNVLIPELSSATNAASQRIQYDGVVADSNAYLIYRTAISAIGSVAQNDLVTSSFYARSQTGCTGFTPFCTVIITDSASSGLTSFNLDLSAAGLSTDWKRFFFTGTATHASSSRTYFYCGAVGGNSTLGLNDGDHLDLELAFPQTEIGIKYPTSFIPTTTTATTRTTISYQIANKGTVNRSAANETLFMRATPFFAANEPTADQLLTSTDTKDRRIEVNTNGTFSSFGNNTDDAGSVATSTGTITRNTSKIFSVALQASGNQNAANYINASADGSTNTDFTSNAWTPISSGAMWTWLGSDNAGANSFDGIIEDFAVFGETLDSTKDATVSNLL